MKPSSGVVLVPIPVEQLAAVSDQLAALLALVPADAPVPTGEPTPKKSPKKKWKGNVTPYRLCDE